MNNMGESVMGKYSMKTVLLAGFLWCLAIIYTFSSTGLLFYGIALGSFAVFVYYRFFKYFRYADRFIVKATLITVSISFFLALFQLEIVDYLSITISLILPIVVSTLPLEGIDNSKEWAVPAVVTLVLTYFVIQNNIVDGVSISGLNENSMAFIGFMSVSLGFFWYKSSNTKILPGVYLIIGFLYLTITKCRNVTIVLPLCFILILIPKKVWKSTVFYRFLYIACLLYTIFTVSLLRDFFNSEWYVYLKSFIEYFISSKNGAMSTRVTFFENAISYIDSLPWYTQLFGRGVRFGVHFHNMWLQSRYIYGYFGTFILYAIFIRIFEMGRILIKNYDDTIALCCVVVLLGHVVLNGADLYLIGNANPSILPQIVMGVIMFRYNQKITSRESNYELERNHSRL